MTTSTQANQEQIILAAARKAAQAKNNAASKWTPQAPYNLALNTYPSNLQLIDDKSTICRRLINKLFTTSVY